jgi:hypothetical protein
MPEDQEHLRQMYRAIFEKEGAEALIEQVLYWRKKSDAIFYDRTYQHQQKRITALAVKLANVRRSAREYKRQIDFSTFERLQELKNGLL